ncbi:hypothetical protein QR680_016892 [Steinernema hermaphroditum]|uniref:Uncharacterized protein n=1 Tax=Steinernema hermaphroditum TaxID=289476 RepID=A0AA39HDR3_9BILA|nr:hypothetical protein QR680_016892 [Steinernema hermaphroditum]
MTSESSAASRVAIPGLEYPELVFNAVSVVVNAYFLLLLKRPFFHLNLRIMLGSFSIGLICLTVTQIVLFVIQKTTSTEESAEVDFATTWLFIFRTSSTLLVMNATFLMALERLFASVFAKKYENNRFWMASLALCLVVWAINTYFAHFLIIKSLCKAGALRATSMKSPSGAPAAAFVGLVQKEHPDFAPCLSSLKNDSETFGVLLFIVILNFIGVVMFLFLFLYNKKRWNVDLKEKLSHRYQIMENIRTSKQLLKVVVADFFITLYFFGILLLNQASSTNAALTVLSQLFNVVCSLVAILLPILFITTHSKMWAVAKGHFSCRRKKRVPRSVQVVGPKKASDSVARAETNAYFSQLQNTWNVGGASRL